MEPHTKTRNPNSYQRGISNEESEIETENEDQRLSRSLHSAGLPQKVGFCKNLLLGITLVALLLYMWYSNSILFQVLQTLSNDYAIMKQTNDANAITLSELKEDTKTQLSSQTQVSVALHAALTNFLGVPKQPQNQSSPSVSTDCPEMDFYTTAMKYKTDKVTDHLYHLMYEKYFPQVRCQAIRILEIGLGCGMSYGPGASYYIWLEYFPFAEIYFNEFNKECAKSWDKLDPRVHVFAGDQANITFLNEFIQQSGGNFNYIVDDGGHYMDQQITSLEILFSTIKPGGLYFIEDLQTSFHPGYGGGENVTTTTFYYLKEIQHDLISRQANMAPQAKSISTYVAGVDCMDEICAVLKKRN